MTFEPWCDMCGLVCMCVQESTFGIHVHEPRESRESRFTGE